MSVIYFSDTYCGYRKTTNEENKNQTIEHCKKHDLFFNTNYTNKNLIKWKSTDVDSLK